MNLEYLREFLTVAEEKNFNEAAELLYINQSTLSKHIKALEKELDVPLFERNTRNVRLTSYGEHLIPYAEKICDLDFRYQRELEQKKKKTLRIGCIPTLPMYGILDMVLDFKLNNPEVILKIDEADSLDLYRNLRSGECEMAFIRQFDPSFNVEGILNTGIRKIPYYTDRLVTIIPVENPISSLSEITLPQLGKHRICMLKEQTLQHEICMNAFKTAGVIPNIFYTSHWTSNILDVCRSSESIAILHEPPHSAVENDSTGFSNQFSVVPIVPKITSTISLCFPENAALSAQARKFISYFKSAISYDESAG